MMGAQSFGSNEAEQLKRKLALLSTIEHAGGDISGQSLEDVALAPDSSPTAGVPPPRVPLAPMAPPASKFTVEKLPPAALPRDDELLASKNSDIDAFNARARELAARQIVGGITRTEVPDVVSQFGTDEKDLLTRRRQTRIDQLRQLEVGNTAAKYAYEKNKNDDAVATSEQRYRDGLKEKGLDNDRAERALRIGADNAAATRSLASSGLGIRQHEVEAKDKDRTDKESAGAMPLMGGTLTLRPGLSDTERGQATKSAADWNAADSAVENFQQQLESFAKSPSIKTKGNVTAALRTASAAFNAAIGGGAMAESEARAMSDAMGADVLNAGGLEAMAQKFLGNDDVAAAESISNRVRAARQANRATALGRLRTYGTFSEGGRGVPSAAPASQRLVVKNPKTGERRYLNDDETLGERVP